MDDFAIYLINLDRSPERLKTMDKRLKKLGLTYERFSAIDGKKTTFFNTEIDEEKYSLLHGKYITPTEVACYISHYEVMKKFLSSKKKYALVLEDDVQFSKEFLAVLSALEKCSDKWDVVKLNGAHGGGKMKCMQLTKKTSLVLNLFHQSKTGAYVINKKAAEAYVKKMLPMFVPVDHEYVKFWKYGLRGFSVYPFPVSEEDVQSTIDYKMMLLNRKPFYKKLPVLIYKTYISLRRVFWVIKKRFTF